MALFILPTHDALHRWATSPSRERVRRVLREYRIERAVRQASDSADEVLRLSCGLCVGPAAPRLDVIRGLDVAEAYRPQSELETADSAAGSLDLQGDVAPGRGC
jgi:hypothetical protein